MNKIAIIFGIIFIVFIIIIGIIFNILKEDFGYDTGLTKEFVSEDGSIVIVVKQDFVSRPTVFYEGKKIFEYKGSGFMETVKWDVEFIDDNIIKLGCLQYNEEYKIEIKLSGNPFYAEDKEYYLDNGYDEPTAELTV